MISLFKRSKYFDNDIVAIADARMFPLEEVKDEVFSKKILGDGIAFELKDGTVCAPANGNLDVLFPTGHSFGIKTKIGTELLVHIGIDTVRLNGKGFKVHAQQGDEVKAGDPIVTVNLDEVSKAGYDLSTVLIITNDNGNEIQFIDCQNVKKGLKINK